MGREGTSIGQFRLDRLLGHGGMGTVYLATDEMTGREVAVKLLRPDLTADEGFVDRFKAEARTLARLDHPRIARLHGFFRHDDDLLMVMEFVRGTTLAQLLKTSGAVAPQTAVVWTGDVLEALHYAHAMGIVHRDVKPANIIIEEQTGRARLTDFGIARSEAESRLTQTGQTVGTIAYMAPEQLTTTEADGRADLYAVGVVLFELLTGRVPYSATTTFTLMREVADGVPPQALEALPEAAAPLRETLRLALAIDPAARFPDGQAFRQALERALHGETAAAPFVDMPTAATTVAHPVVETTGTPAARRPAWVLGAAALVLVGLVAAGVAWSQRRPAPATPDVSSPATAPVTADTAAPADTAPAAPALVVAPPAPGTTGGPADTGRAASTAGPAPTRSPAATPEQAPSARISRQGASPAAQDNEASAVPDDAAAEEPSAAAPARASRPPAEFTRALLMVEVEEDGETDTEEVDVLLRFDGQRLMVLNAETRVPLKRIAYTAIGNATYTEAQSRIKLFRGPAHWLDLQLGREHVVLRLDKRNYSEILDELDARGARVLRAERR